MNVKYKIFKNFTPPFLESIHLQDNESLSTIKQMKIV